MQVIHDFIPKEWVVHKLMWLLPLFLFPCREQRGVQETGAVDHIHRHGDQSSGDSVYGPLLPQQVREYKHKNIHINIHHEASLHVHLCKLTLLAWLSFIQSPVVVHHSY